MLVEDLEKVDPRGRLDVMGFRLAEHFTRMLEGQYGVSGIWENLKPHVNEVISKNLGKIELPVEAKIILGII
jgi:hypothetical protein